MLRPTSGITSLLKAFTLNRQSALVRFPSMFLDNLPQRTLGGPRNRTQQLLTPLPESFDLPLRRLRLSRQHRRQRPLLWLFLSTHGPAGFLCRLLMNLLQHLLVSPHGLLPSLPCVRPPPPVKKTWRSCWTGYLKNMVSSCSVDAGSILWW